MPNQLYQAVMKKKLGWFWGDILDREAETSMIATVQYYHIIKLHSDSFSLSTVLTSGYRENKGRSYTCKKSSRYSNRAVSHNYTN